jgi:hypothetical protein
MAQHSLPDNVVQEEEKNLLAAQIRESYGRVVYSHKSHEKAADIYLARLHRIKVFQITLSALTTGSLLYHLFSGNKAGTIIAAILSAILFVLNIYTKEYNLAELSQKHHDAAQKLWGIRESYLSLLTDLTANTLNSKVIREKRDILQDNLNQVYIQAPRTFKQAYEQARKGLHIHEEMTFSEEEIDRLLPEKMRK